MEKAKQRAIERNSWIKESLTDEPFQVHAIFIPMTPNSWEQDIQIMMDVLSTEDGRVAKKWTNLPPNKHIPIFTVNPDIMAPLSFHLPRLVHGAFLLALKEIYK